MRYVALLLLLFAGAASAQTKTYATLYPPSAGPYATQIVTVGQSGNIYNPNLGPQPVYYNDIPALMQDGWSTSSGGLSPPIPFADLQTATPGTMLCGPASGSAASPMSCPSYISVNTVAGIAAAAGGSAPLHIPAGTYAFGTTSLTFSVPVQFDVGAQITCTGSNLSFTSTIYAPQSQIFSAGCTPNLSGTISNFAGYAEWWGAKADYTNGGTGTGTDNAAAFNAAIQSGIGQILLGSGQYRYATKLSFNHSNFVLSGVSRDVTKLFFDDPTGTSDGMLVSSASPATTIENLQLNRIQAATAGACFHILDTYFVQVLHVAMYNNCWDEIFIDGESADTNQIWVKDNQVFNALNDAIRVYGASTTSGSAIGEAADVFIEGSNYIKTAARAGVEMTQNVNGVFVADNVIFSNAYGVYGDTASCSTVSCLNDIKIRHNDIDNNSSAAYFHNLSGSHYQQNWIGGGSTTFVAGSGIVGGGNNFYGATGTLILNGTNDFASAGDNFNSGTAPVLIENAAEGISITGATWDFGSGVFVTFSGSSSSDITIGAQVSANTTLTSGNANHLTILTPDGTNNNQQSRSRVLYGQSNVVSSDVSMSGGYGNNVSGYGGSSFGQYNTTAGSFSSNNGVNANDEGRNGMNCWAGGGWSNGITSAVAQTCQFAMQAQTTSTTATRMVASGTTQSWPITPNSNNCLNIPVSTAYEIEGTLLAQDTTSYGNIAAVYGIKGLLYRGSSGNATWLSQAAGTTGGVGTGASLTVALAADTTNQCLSATVTAPNSDTWHWVFRGTTTEDSQ